jgi:hypothetical protein
MNDILATDPSDATETMEIFEFMSIFKRDITDEEQQVNNNKECKTKYFLRDDNIKLITKEKKIQKAFVKLIINSYSEAIVNNNVNDFVETDGSIIDEILNVYEITQNQNDIILLSEFNETNKNSLMQFTKAKIKQTLSSKGIEQVVIKINKKSERVLKGIKIKK